MSGEKKFTVRKWTVWIMKVWPLLPATLYLGGFLVIVLVYLLGLTFRNQDSSSVLFAADRFRDLLSRPEFIDALVNTFWFVIIGTPLELITGLILALLLYWNFRLRGILRSVFLIPLAVPALVTAMLLYILFDHPGGHVNHLLLGNYPPVPGVIDQPIAWRSSGVLAMAIAMLGKIWRDTPISMLILLAGLNTIDTELFDAAKTMGASTWKRFRYVVFPLLIPSMSAVVLLRSVEMWKEFIFPFVLAGRYRLLGTLIDFYYNDTGNAPMAAAVALILVACIAISTLVYMVASDGAKKVLSRR